MCRLITHRCLDQELSDKDLKDPSEVEKIPGSRLV